MAEKYRSFATIIGPTSTTFVLDPRCLREEAYKAAANAKAITINTSSRAITYFPQGYDSTAQCIDDMSKQLAHLRKYRG